jgi:hypothetical protein
VKRTAAHVFSTIVAIYYPFRTASVRPTLPPSEVHMAELWQRPDDLASRDLARQTASAQRSGRRYFLPRSRCPTRPARMPRQAGDFV